MSKSDRFVILADARAIRVVRVEPMPEGRWRASIVRELVAPEPEPPDERPGMLRMPGNIAGAPPIEVSEQGRERLRRFAREAGDFLSTALSEHAVDRAPLFSASTMLGILRDTLPAALRDRLDDHALDLSSIPVHELVEHKKVREALSLS